MGAVRREIGQRSDSNVTRPGILAVNAGSSSVKVGLFELDQSSGALSPIAALEVSGLGEQRGVELELDAHDGLETETSLLVAEATHRDAFAAVLAAVVRRFPDLQVIGVGHRVVHGGTWFSAPTPITEEVVDRLRQLNPLAPLHEPHNIEGIEAVTAMLPDVPQVACFDTAFHSTVVGPASQFAIPRSLAAEGVRRYGFHGLSYQYIADRLPEYLGADAEGRVIVAHLGAGASLCALQGRKSIATTMSMTPLDGLPMATRSGSIDPGAILYLESALGMSTAEVSHLLYEECGLLGLSDMSPSMELLLASDDPAAEEAVEHFVYWCAREIGSLAAALEGLDAIVFTAGIGEHSAEIRWRVMRALQWLGVEGDKTANAAHGPRISSSDSRVSCWVIPTDEEIVVARAAARLAVSDDRNATG